MTTQPRKTLPYTISNSTAAKTFIEGHVGPAHEWAWVPSMLLAPTRVEQTRKALGTMMSELNEQFRRYAEQYASWTEMRRLKQITQSEFEEEEKTYNEWCERAKRFKVHIQNRIDQADDARKRLNIALSTLHNVDQDRWARDMLAHVVEQVFLHWQFTDTDDGGYEPSEYDRILWSMLVDTKTPDGEPLLDLIKRKNKIDKFPGYQEAS